MDIITLVNLVFCIIILFFGIKKYKDTGAKAFIFISLGFLMYGISHFSGLMGWSGGMKDALIVVRAAGYILVIIGLLV